MCRDAVIDKCKIYNNLARAPIAGGGGIAGNDLTITDSIVRDNKFIGEEIDAGGILGNSLTLTNCAIVDNQGGGLRCEQSAGTALMPAPRVIPAARADRAVPYRFESFPSREWRA